MDNRTKEPRPAYIEKFMKLESDKRDRIINAAMKEFRYGYKKASTDIIVKEAGISKGLLFHYFGTKEQLYTFLSHYVSDIINSEFYSMINKGNKDILEVFWQAALLQKDVVERYPYLYDFINGMHIHKSDAPVEFSVNFEKELLKTYEEICKQCDTGLLRDDIDHLKALVIISLTLNSLFADEDSKISAGGWDEEKYEQFLEALRGYMDIFRTCFYKKPE